jgi:KDO2-lipid IV(A) lauroyltransferase
VAKKSALASWSEYLALRGASALLHCSDVQENMHRAAGVGSLLCRSNPGRRERAERNIALSFPGWPTERVRWTAERSMQHMLQLFMVDAFVMPRLVTPNTWPAHVELGDLERVLDRLIAGEPMILVTGHFGNWELLGYALSVVGFPMAALARPLDNPLLNAWLLNLREMHGLQVVTKWGATPIVQEVLEEGGRVGFIADQNAGDGGLFVPFFGRLASCYKSMGMLAMRHRVPVVAGCARRVGDQMRYELACTDLIEPDEWEDQTDPLFYLTARISRALEVMVASAPEQYLWIHRRWKSRPRHERLHRPFPARLREKLAGLPWMTDDELARIVQLSEDPEHREVGSRLAAAPAGRAGVGAPVPAHQHDRTGTG